MDYSMMEYAFFQGRIVPFADAKISIGTHTVQYGTGAFAGIRGYLDDDGTSINIFRLPDHAQRLLNSGRLLRAALLPFQGLVKLGAPIGNIDGAAHGVPGLHQDGASQDRTGHLGKVAPTQLFGLQKRRIGFESQLDTPGVGGPQLVLAALQDGHDVGRQLNGEAVVANALLLNGRHVEISISACPSGTSCLKLIRGCGHPVKPNCVQKVAVNVV